MHHLMSEILCLGYKAKQSSSAPVSTYKLLQTISRTGSIPWQHNSCKLGRPHQTTFKNERNAKDQIQGFKPSTESPGRPQSSNKYVFLIAVVMLSMLNAKLTAHHAALMGEEEDSLRGRVTSFIVMQRNATIKNILFGRCWHPNYSQGFQRIKQQVNQLV